MAQFFLIIVVCYLLPKLTLGVADADHTLVHNQTIAVGQSLVSETKFLSWDFSILENLETFFWGWYKAMPEVVVWIANWNNPITHSQGVVIAISSIGSLAMSRGGTRWISLFVTISRHFHQTSTFTFCWWFYVQILAPMWRGGEGKTYKDNPFINCFWGPCLKLCQWRCTFIKRLKKRGSYKQWLV